VARALPGPGLRTLHCWRHPAAVEYLGLGPILLQNSLKVLSRSAGSPADFGKLIADETEKWGKVVRAANIKPE
jgi:hypothetical protein